MNAPNPEPLTLTTYDKLKQFVDSRIKALNESPMKGDGFERLAETFETQCFGALNFAEFHKKITSHEYGGLCGYIGMQFGKLLRDRKQKPE